MKKLDLKFDGKRLEGLKKLKRKSYFFVWNRNKVESG